MKIDALKPVAAIGHFLVAGFLVLLPRVVGAQVVNATDQKRKYNFPDELGGADVPKIINGLITSVLGLVGALFFVMFLWGGFTWLTAGGDGKKVENARKTLTNATIGMLIVGLSYAIVTNVLELIILGKAGG